MYEDISSTKFQLGLGRPWAKDGHQGEKKRQGTVISLIQRTQSAERGSSISWEREQLKEKIGDRELSQ